LLCYLASFAREMSLSQKPPSRAARGNDELDAESILGGAEGE
jgi:hypothetical protein